jgi:ketosteroid isomerase-like protein
MAPDTTPPVTLDTLTAETIAAVEQFNAAFNRQDVEAVMAAMTDDCVFENTPAPDGERYEGAAAVRAFWQRFFAESPHARFEAEERFAAGDRCVVRWRYTWRDAVGGEGHVRGVDLFRVRDGKVAEKLAYVKG